MSDEALSRRAYLEAVAQAVDGMVLLAAISLIVQMKTVVRIKDGILHTGHVCGG